MKFGKLFLGVSGLIFLGLAIADQSIASSFKYANKIHAVWALSSQPCGESYGNSMSQYPESEEIIKSKSVTIPSIGFKFDVPQFASVKETVVKIFLNDTSRGVTDHYFLLSNSDFQPPYAAVVVTELPSNMRNTNEAFNAVKILQERNLKGLDVELELKPINGLHGESLEMLIHDRVGSHCFPTADMTLLPATIDLDTIGISRFSLIDSKLVEFSILLVIPKGMDASAAESYARDEMDSFWRLIKSI